MSIMKKICIKEGRNPEKQITVYSFSTPDLRLIIPPSEQHIICYKPPTKTRYNISLFSLDHLNMAKMRIILITPKRAPNKTGAVYMFS